MRSAWLYLFFAGMTLHGADGFDVASVRPHAPDDTRFGVKMPNGGRFSSTGAAVKLLLMVAFDVQESQIVGGPDWLGSEKWDIEAKRDDAGQKYDAAKTRAMLQGLLEERFALRTHRETAQRPAYVLTVAKGGIKFKAGEEGGSNLMVTRRSIRLEHAEMARFTQVLSGALGRPVIDRTGLTGIFDLNVEWDEAPNPNGVLGLDEAAPPDYQKGSIFSAMQEQLGLRLEQQRVPVEVLVIDRIERPSIN